MNLLHKQFRHFSNCYFALCSKVSVFVCQPFNREIFVPYRSLVLLDLSPFGFKVRYFRGSLLWCSSQEWDTWYGAQTLCSSAMPCIGELSLDFGWPPWSKNCADTVSLIRLSFHLLMWLFHPLLYRSCSVFRSFSERTVSYVVVNLLFIL